MALLYLFGQKIKVLCDIIENCYNIETIAVVLTANYSTFTEDYAAYEERYIERFGCFNEATRKNNEWLISDLSAGISDRKIYKQLLSMYNTGDPFLYRSDESGDILINDYGRKYSSYTEEYLDPLKDIMEIYE